MLNLTKESLDSACSVGCDLHVLNLDLNHSIQEMCGPRGDMNHPHAIQLAFKISYLYGQNWTEMRGLLKNKINQIIEKSPGRNLKNKWKVSSIHYSMFFSFFFF